MARAQIGFESSTKVSWDRGVQHGRDLRCCTASRRFRSDGRHSSPAASYLRFRHFRQRRRAAEVVTTGGSTCAFLRRARRGNSNVPRCCTKTESSSTTSKKVRSHAHERRPRPSVFRRFSPGGRGGAACSLCPAAGHFAGFRSRRPKIS